MEASQSVIRAGSICPLADSSLISFSSACTWAAPPPRTSMALMASPCEVTTGDLGVDGSRFMPVRSPSAICPSVKFTSCSISSRELKLADLRMVKE